ncbi:MAG: 6,7-dimethyl-8-ribityllumazine synthase [Muribaculaceae bacterium]|nr:6,7-dimethyl-8-ribityllumazine synthase [Muribaculaceae bacterium]
MSTILNTEGNLLDIPEIRDKEHFRVAVVTADWNRQVNDRLLAGAVDVFKRAGIPDERVELYSVPGAVELVYAAARIIKSPKKYNAVVVIGTVIRGDTPHFDYVCSQAADGVCRLNCEGEVPVIFGVLTVNHLQQALDRAGGPLGNKGAEAAVAALTMGTFLRM